MSDESSSELSSLTAALKAAQLEQSEAYIQSDWHRVWELANRDIPKLERQIAALTGGEIEAEDPSWLKPMDFEWMMIDLIDSKNSLINTYIRRQPAQLKQVKVLLVFSQPQKVVIERNLLDHRVFYGSADDVPVTVADLVKGVWTSQPMNDEEADKTAENARDGVNDLRLIIQERARHPSG